MNYFENQLNAKQKYGLEIMKSGKNVFLSGQAGSGKSYLLKVFIKHCIQNNIIHGVTSTTGVSALLINGVTIHSFSGILLGLEDKVTLLERVRSRDAPFKRWLYTQVLIIDEISMMSGELLEKLDFIGKNIRKSSKPFGGMQLILTGDFTQLPPIKSSYCFKNPIWDTLIDINIYLTENMRQTDDVFQNILTEARLGELSSNSIEILQSRIGAHIVTMDGIIPTKLFSHRATVAKMNQDNLMALVKDNNPLISFHAKDDAKRKNGKMLDSKYKDEYLGHIDKTFQAVKKLDICIGAQVMLLFNLDVTGGLANGSRGVVIGFKNDLPLVRFINGIETPIGLHSWSMQIGEDIIVSRRQIPLMLAWSTTIHKTQGATLDCAQIDLGSTIFEFGQAYTALSRCKCLDCISIVTFDPSKIECSPDVKEFYNNISLSKDKEVKVEENNNKNGLCIICCDKEINSIIIPCGHCSCCINCSYNIDKCPICRNEITSRNKVYLPN